MTFVLNDEGGGKICHRDLPTFNISTSDNNLCRHSLVILLGDHNAYMAPSRAALCLLFLAYGSGCY